MQLKANDGCRRIRRYLSFVGPNSEYREQITVWVIARRRTRTAVSRSAEVGTGLQRPLRQLCGLPIAGIKAKLGDVRRDVYHHPVPEAAAGRCIRIETSNSEALRSGGCSRPRQM